MRIFNFEIEFKITVRRIKFLTFTLPSNSVNLTIYNQASGSFFTYSCKNNIIYKRHFEGCKYSIIVKDEITADKRILKLKLIK